MAAGLDVTPLMTHSFGIDEAETALQIAADQASGSRTVMLLDATPREQESN